MTDDSRRVAVVIEDDTDIRALVETVLRQAGFAVKSTASGVEGVELVRLIEPDVVTLDIGLIDIDGLEVARRIRLFSDCYIVMLTAQSNEADLLFGLGSGADDYVTKPFRPRELRTRVETMLRRPRTFLVAAEAEAGAAAAKDARSGPAVAPFAAGADAMDETVLVHNGLLLNADTRMVSVGGSEIMLTRTEFDLLRALLQSNRRVRSRTDLVRAIRDDLQTSSVTEAEERVIEVHLANLRRKLADDPKKPRWIETIRGFGYRLSPETAD